MTTKLVLASNNSGKLAELQALFAPLGVELVRQSDLGIPEAPEPHRTFIENALAKARHAARDHRVLRAVPRTRRRRRRMPRTPGRRSQARLVALRHADDPEPLVATGRAPGLITQERVGSQGFGFDPVMYLPALGKTFAELSPEVKNAHSHRGQAAQQMLALMRERWFAPAS